MNTARSLAAALGVLVTTATAGILYFKDSGVRSAGPVQLAATLPSRPAFSREASTGLFVGVREFPRDETLTVPYAADDAVDLAHRFVLDARVRLVPPRRAVVVLSGDPQKEESKQRLRELKDAGAKVVYGATSGDILQLLQEQAAHAGTDGLLVFSVASHGFQHDGDAYILGSSSEFGSTETSLRVARLLDVAARVPRSLIFIDACRERIGAARSGTPDAAGAAPHISRMKRVQGQVIFYAAAPGEYAFDDPVLRNGVFTKAVLDGLDCKASATRGTVPVNTLHAFVDRQVRQWIRENKGRDVNPATQVSMEGQTRNMPLATCWCSPSRCIRVSVDGSAITAYDTNTSPLWRKDLGEAIVRAEAVDLDADAFCEVVIGLRDRVTVLDRDGKPRWTRGVETMTLQTFATGDLFEKRTNPIIALWNDGRTSRLTVLDDDGNELSRFDHAGVLQHVAVGRPTKMHAPKIVAATPTMLILLHARKLEPLWPPRILESTDEPIRGLDVLDADRDNRGDIAVHTRSGTTWFTFDGKILRQNPKVRWQDVKVRRRR